MPSSKLILRIALISAVVGSAVALGLGALYGLHSGLSAVAGCVLGVVNLWVLARLVTAVLDDRNPSVRRGRAAVLLGAKSIALVTLIGVLVVNGWVRGGALMAGLTAVAFSIVLGGVMQGSDDDAPEQPSTDDDPSSHRSLS